MSVGLYSLIWNYPFYSFYWVLVNFPFMLCEIMQLLLELAIKTKIPYRKFKIYPDQVPLIFFEIHFSLLWTRIFSYNTIQFWVLGSDDTYGSFFWVENFSLLVIRNMPYELLGMTTTSRTNCRALYDKCKVLDIFSSSTKNFRTSNTNLLLLTILLCI